MFFADVLTLPGMFLYIAMTEVIPEEFAQHSCDTKDKWIK
jgi:hypothetical protein